MKISKKPRYGFKEKIEVNSPEVESIISHEKKLFITTIEEKTSIVVSKGGNA